MGGVSKPHFTNEKTDAKDTRGARQNVNVTPGRGPHTLGPRLLAVEETLAKGLGWSMPRWMSWALGAVFRRDDCSGPACRAGVVGRGSAVAPFLKARGVWRTQCTWGWPPCLGKEQSW